MLFSSVLFIALLLIPELSLSAGTDLALTEVVSIPSEHGEVVFSCNESSPKKIYVIGISHRDTLTLANGSDTVRSQIEVYKIGDWLIQNSAVELLLPEGFFLNEASDERGAVSVDSLSVDDKRVSFDTKTLEEKLEDVSSYVNAEMLLMESHDLNSQQVEDIDLYNAVIEKIGLLQQYSDDTYESLFIRSGLDYLQERRTAVMLQMIPEVIESEYGIGRINNKEAIFTIGISHISLIIRYLKQEKIEINSPAFTRYDDYLSGVRLLEDGYGVTIIIPRSLADDRDLLRLTGLADDN